MYTFPHRVGSFELFAKPIVVTFLALGVLRKGKFKFPARARVNGPRSVAWITVMVDIASIIIQLLYCTLRRDGIKLKLNTGIDTIEYRSGNGTRPASESTGTRTDGPASPVATK